MAGFSTGVLLSPVRPPQESVALAQAIEESGYDSIWVADEGVNTRDVFVTMAAIATATSRLRIGTGLVNPYTRHPALTASAIATIDELSEGRAFLVFGTGGTMSLGPLGIDRERPVPHVREALEVSRRLLDGETVEFAGETVQLRNARLAGPRPEVEVWFAGRSPAVLGVAGAVADGVLLEFLHKPSLGTYVEQVAVGARRAGRALPRLVYSTIVLTDRGRLDEIRPQMTFRLVDSPDAVKEQLGITPAHVREIRDAMRGGLAAAAPLIPDEWIEPFILLGDRDRIADEIAALRDRHGFEGFVVLLADHAHPQAEITLGADILSRVR